MSAIIEAPYYSLGKNIQILLDLSKRGNFSLLAKLKTLRVKFAKLKQK